MSSHNRSAVRHPPHGQIEYLQLPADDIARSAEFYEAVFGWSTDRASGSFQAPGMIGQLTTERPAAATGGRCCGSAPTTSIRRWNAWSPLAAPCTTDRNWTTANAGSPRSTTRPVTGSAWSYRSAARDHKQ